MKTIIKKLPIVTKVGYGICDMGGNLFFTVIGFWLLIYLTDTVGLSPFLAGIALLIGRVFDAFADPAVGYLSDRTVTRWGKRRPYIFIGSFLLTAAMIYLFINPHITYQINLFIWASISFTLLSFSYTLVNIPYSSLTPLLTQDYNERTSLNSYRFTFAIIGSFIGAGAGLPIINAFSKSSLVTNAFLPVQPASAEMAIRLLFGPIGALFYLAGIIVLSFYPIDRKMYESIRKKIDTVRQKTGGSNAEAGIKKDIIGSYLSTLKNRPFLLIVIPWFLNMCGVTVLSGMFTYYFNYVRHSPEQITAVMVTLLLSSMIFIPIWVLISKKIGKKYSYMAGMGIVAVMMMIFFLIGKDVGFSIFLVLVALCGIGFSTGYLLPWSILPDAIDYDYALSGEKREGVYYGLWTFYLKLGQAFASVLMGWLLQINKYIEPAHNGAGDKSSGFTALGIICGMIMGITALITFFTVKEREGSKVS